MANGVGFKVNGAQFDRGSILQEAARLIDAASGHLGPGGQPAETDEGKLTRALAADEARLPAYPDVYRITDEDFLAQHKPQPVAIGKLAENFNFYWIRFPIGLRPQQHWGFNMIEVRVEFGADEAAPHLRPKAYRILPDQRFQDLLRANMTLEFKLNENLEFEASTGKLSASSGTAAASGAAGVGGELKASAGAVFGPFQYGVKKAKIEHSAPGLEWVFWRLDGAEFFQEDTPELITVLQMPKALRQCTIRAELQASRYFNFGAAPWQKAIAQIPAMLRRFFEEGMPLRDERPWDITPSL
jgi:hypothetical protein